MHYWTAPGSIRGAVDFISLGGHYWNLAEFFIIGATPLLLLATTYQAHRAASLRATGPAAPATSVSWRPRVPVVAAAGAALITAVALGATHHGTLARPMRASRLTGPSGWLTPGPSHQREVAPDEWGHGGDR